MTEGNPSLHYTNPLSLVLLARNNLIQGWMESRDTVSALGSRDDNTYNQKIQRLAKLNNEKQ